MSETTRDYVLAIVTAGLSLVLMLLAARFHNLWYAVLAIVLILSSYGLARQSGLIK